MEYYSDWTEELKVRAVKEYTGLLKQITAVIGALGVEDRVRIDTVVLGKAVVDCIEDIIKLEQYEGIIANIAKIYAYTTYWLLKRNVIMVIDEESEGTLFINEKVCTAILISKMQEEKKVKDNDNQYFVNLLFYNFKYRLFTQKSLELAIEAYFHGCDVGRRNS